jgi:hypothetical protein
MKTARNKRSKNPLNENLRILFEELAVVKKKAEAMGVFTADRDLLECPRCALQEDVLIGGILIVTRSTNRKDDCGLRFRPLNNRANQFQCPACNFKFDLKSS